MYFLPCLHEAQVEILYISQNDLLNSGIPLSCSIQLFIHIEKKQTARVTVMVRERESFQSKKRKKKKKWQKKSQHVFQLQCSQVCWGYCQRRNWYVCLLCDGCFPVWLLNVSAKWRLRIEALPLWFRGWHQTLMLNSCFTYLKKCLLTRDCIHSSCIK